MFYVVTELLLMMAYLRWIDSSQLYFFFDARFHRKNGSGLEGMSLSWCEHIISLPARSSSQSPSESVTVVFTWLTTHWSLTMLKFNLCLNGHNQTSSHLFICIACLCLFSTLWKRWASVNNVKLSWQWTGSLLPSSTETNLKLKYLAGQSRPKCGQKLNSAN